MEQKVNQPSRSKGRFSCFPCMARKRAMFFTMIVIFIITLFFLSYTIYDVIKDRSSINKRVETLNNFVFSIEQDIPRYLYISGFRSVFLLQEEIVTTNNYVSDVDGSFQELFYNGTLNGNEKDLMIGARFGDIQDNFEQFGRKVNANISFYFSDVFLDQQDPWNIRVHMDLNLIVEDLGGLVGWNKTISVDSFVPIIDFEDPLYLVETGQITNTIIRTPYEDFVDGADISNLLSHVENSYYYASISAPSFLDRMEGRTDANENGIESFVYLPELTGQSIGTSDKSCVDYIYFSSDNPPDYSVTGMPSWFKIDNQDSHLSIYEVDGLV